MSSDIVAKICPSCKLKDVTSFSKCRDCGTRYDAQIAAPRGSGIDQKVLLIALGVAGFFGSFVWGSSAIKEAKLKAMAPLVAEVKAANRPRVLEFYAQWCGSCSSYGPAVENCKAKYAGRIDVVRIDIDSGNPLSRMFRTKSIPRTCLFDRHGNEIDEVAGDIGEERLDKLMQHLIAL
ncbi:MAG: thioredoxin domain-containing protein [Candidatus Obscuribacterales bacterium]|nr:thioredoxin domain-containing protein [Candidatus Obscuribacterales bacterium]